MNPSRLLRTFFTATVLGALTFNAHALFDDNEARKAILDLRQKVDAQQLRNAEDLKKANDDNAQLRRSIFELSNQLEALRAEIAKMRGQDEQLARDVAEVQRKQKDITQGVDERLRKFEPSKVAVDGNEFVANPAEIRDFDSALATLRKGEFAAAQTAFLEFLRRYPESGYRPSALFWLGNAQYALRAYREAIINFKSVVVIAPDHLRSPEAALSIANCQVELKDNLSARKTLNDLIMVYPQSEAASVAKDRLTKLK
ncbi:MAG: tol-pal system protein YbgF [Polaromonas sp.]|nr:tol-pal system protein YbgF [Polaromonas sp.]